MTTITIDLAEILEAKFQRGFSIPVSIDIGDFLDLAEDDWSETVDLDQLLAEREEAAIIVSAQEAKRIRPHLSDQQAWEVAQSTREQTQWMLEDLLGDVADDLYPDMKRGFQRRVAELSVRLSPPQPWPDEAKELLQQLVGLQQLINKLPEYDQRNPALEAAIRASLDDIEAVLSGWQSATKEG